MSLKLNLLVNKLEFLNGYKNISPFAPVDDSRFARNSVIDLEALADDGEIAEIRALDVIEYYPLQDLDGIIKNWVSKLAHKGTLTIGGTDIYILATAIGSFELKQEDIIETIYGVPKPGQQKKSIYNINFIVGCLKNYGLKIIRKTLLSNGQYIVTGERE